MTSDTRNQVQMYSRNDSGKNRKRVKKWVREDKEADLGHPFGQLKPSPSGLLGDPGDLPWGGQIRREEKLECWSGDFCVPWWFLGTLFPQLIRLDCVQNKLTPTAREGPQAEP